MHDGVVQLDRHGKDYFMLQNSPMYSYIPAKDVKRARRFYEQTIGLKAKGEVGDDMVIYEFGKGTACFLYQTPNAGTSKASQAFWQVDDIEREVAELKKRGVKFEEYDMPDMKPKNSIYTGGGAKAAWFKDSEGNILALIEEDS
jgi:predicted enzyme related to lactoylglutathione lyase